MNSPAGVFPIRAPPPTDRLSDRAERNRESEQMAKYKQNRTRGHEPEPCLQAEKLKIRASKVDEREKEAGRTQVRGRNRGGQVIGLALSSTPLISMGCWGGENKKGAVSRK